MDGGERGRRQRRWQGGETRQTRLPRPRGKREGDSGAAEREQARRRGCHGFFRAAAAAIVQRRKEATGKETKAVSVMEGGDAFMFLLRQSLMMMGGDRGYRSLAVTAGSAAAGNPWCGGDSGSVRDRREEVFSAAIFAAVAAGSGDDRDDDTGICWRLQRSIRANGFFVFVPKYGIEGPVYLTPKGEKGGGEWYLDEQLIGSRLAKSPAFIKNRGGKSPLSQDCYNGGTTSSMERISPLVTH